MLIGRRSRFPSSFIAYQLTLTSYIQENGAAFTNLVLREEILEELGIPLRIYGKSPFVYSFDLANFSRNNRLPVSNNAVKFTPKSRRNHVRLNSERSQGLKVALKQLGFVFLRSTPRKPILKTLRLLARAA